MLGECLGGTLAVMRRRSMLLAVGLSATLALSACGGGGSESTAGPTTSAGTSASSAAAQLTVMTRNLYLGGDLTPLLHGGNPLALLAQVQASKPAERMAAVAAEIAGAKPDVVGLQEVARWEIKGGATYDFAELLLAALQKAGVPYDVAVAQDNFDSAKLPNGDTLPARFLDRDVMLVRADAGITVGAAAKHYYAKQLSYDQTALGVPVTLTRGWVQADLTRSGTTYQVVDTHFEAFNGPDGTDYTAPQADELVAALAGSSGRLVVLGDLNSGPGDTERHGYEQMRAGGYADVAAPGVTCCRNADLSGGELTERIDMVMVRGVQGGDARLVGVDPVGPAAPRWASDHAGVVAAIG